VAKTTLFVFFLSLLSAQLFCGEVTLVGKSKASKYAGKEMLAFRYADYISYTREIQETDTVKPDGTFRISFDITSPQRIYLCCDHLKAPLYIEPGRTYEVTFPEKDSVHFRNPNLDQDGDLFVQMNDTTELNLLITDFNLRFDDFWRKNNEYFVVKKWHNIHLLLDSFALAMNKRYAQVRSSYLHSYIDYTIASNLISTFESENIIARNYLRHKPVLYGNTEYMDFFNQFFDKYFYQFALKPQGALVFSAVNDRGSSTALMDALKPAPFLENDTLRELVMLKGLFENYSNHDFSQSHILGILEEVSETSKVAEHRLIARNIISHFTVMKRGTPAPAFNLPDRTGKMVSLNDFKGKYIYLNFISSTCADCMTEMKLLHELEKKYPHITVISISLDEKEEDMKKMLKQNPKWNWIFLYSGKAGQLKRDYNILAMPYAYLIGPDGKLILSPAPGPFEELEDVFYNITRKKEKKYRVGE
jgi:thiol-disulfide isomerase/thioredoxin